MKFSGILSAFLYVLPAVFITFLWANYSDSIRGSFISPNSYSLYKSLNKDCGRTIKYVCSYDINNLNISNKDKWILKSAMFDGVINIMLIGIYIFGSLYICLFAGKKGK